MELSSIPPCGASKSGAALNESAPAVVIPNSAASVPLRANVTLSAASGSAAATVPTAVRFSARLKVASDVNAGGSLTSVTVTVRSWVAVSARSPTPPVAVTVSV